MVFMNVRLSKQHVGQSIAQLRKNKGLSQAELAKLINVSRSSIAQMELGNRSIDIFELKKLSQVLVFSLDEFMSDGFSPSDKYVDDEDFHKRNFEKPKERVSSPVFNIRKFKNVLLYILERCAGKPNVGETVLNKLLYFSDFNYYECYEEHLTGATYRKLPYGPVPKDLDKVVKSMIEKGHLQRVKSDYHGFPQTRYLPLIKPDLTELRASEKEMIDRVVDQMSDWSAVVISNYSHKDMPWLASKEGEIIDYELSFYRDAPFSVRNYHDEIDE